VTVLIEACASVAIGRIRQSEPQAVSLFGRSLQCANSRVEAGTSLRLRSRRCGISSTAGKPDLFHIHQLEQLRSTCRGSAAANLSIDCAIEAVQGGLKGQAAVESTLRNALEETMRSAFRGMNEHYQREATPKETHNLRARLDAARHKLDCGAVANELLPRLNRLHLVLSNCFVTPALMKVQNAHEHSRILCDDTEA
jgi:hypothetical protein